jgi:glycosyltransferase involved in cell wall biosynthesis
MKILVISYHYLPEENPRVFRWSSIVSYWLSCGYDVSVITASQDKYEGKTQDCLNIIRVPENLIGKIRYKISRENPLRAEINDTKLPISGNSAIISKWIKGLYALVIKRIQWPDFAWTWILNARKATLQHLEGNPDIDVIISVSHPFSSHVVGSIAKRKYPNIRWIMDIGDPFNFLVESQPNNFLIYNKLNKFIERKYFSLSDFVSVTTSETMSEYLKLFPENKGKIKVIPPVLSTDASNILKTRKKKHQLNHKAFRLVYVGTLYSGIRHPQKMLSMLADVRTRLNSDFEVHFFGPGNDVDISKLTNSYTFFHGSVSHDAALEFMLSADILINIGNSTKFQLPSKLVEYVCTGNPVLNIISTIDDSSQAFLSSYKMSKTIQLSGEITNDIVREVSDYIKFASTHSFRLNDENLSKYSVNNISKQYELMFN